MQAKVDWKGRMTFVGTSDSGFSVNLDTESSVGGENNGFRPLELMAISLAGCTSMDVISILTKKRQEVTDFEVRIDLDRAEEHPRVFTSARIDYLVTGKNVDEQAVVRAIQLSTERYCPAQAMLGKAFPMALRYQIFEKENGERKLVKESLFSLSEN